MLVQLCAQLSYCFVIGGLPSPEHTSQHSEPLVESSDQMPISSYLSAPSTEAGHSSFCIRVSIEPADTAED